MDRKTMIRPLMNKLIRQFKTVKEYEDNKILSKIEI